MTEEELYNRYHEIQSTYVEIKFVDGESLIGKLDSFVSGVDNEPDEASIYVVSTYNFRDSNSIDYKRLVSLSDMFPFYWTLSKGGTYHTYIIISLTVENSKSIIGLDTIYGIRKNR